MSRRLYPDSNSRSSRFWRFHIIWFLRFGGPRCSSNSSKLNVRCDDAYWYQHIVNGGSMRTLGLSPNIISWKCTSTVENCTERSSRRRRRQSRFLRHPFRPISSAFASKSLNASINSSTVDKVVLEIGTTASRGGSKCVRRRAAGIRIVFSCTHRSFEQSTFDLRLFCFFRSWLFLHHSTTKCERNKAEDQSWFMVHG